MVKVIRALDGKIIEIEASRILKDELGTHVDFGADGTCDVEILPDHEKYKEVRV